MYKQTEPFYLEIPTRCVECVYYYTILSLGCNFLFTHFTLNARACVCVVVALFLHIYGWTHTHMPLPNPRARARGICRVVCLFCCTLYVHFVLDIRTVRVNNVCALIEGELSCISSRINHHQPANVCATSPRTYYVLKCTRRVSFGQYLYATHTHKCQEICLRR